MKIRIVGFEWQMGKGITLDEFLTHLTSLKGTEFKHAGYNRLLRVTTSKPYHVGLLVTVKDQRRFCELTGQGGSLLVKVRDVEEGTNLMEFNFFVIHQDTGRGLYQHYHQSCSVNQFCVICRGHYSNLKSARIEAELKKPGNQQLTESQKQTIRAKYRGLLKGAQMIRLEKLDELLNEFTSIQSFEFDLMTVFDEESLFTPVSKYARRMSHKIGFKPKRKLIAAAMDEIRLGIKKVVKGKALTKGCITGKDMDGIEQIVRLMENPDCFGEYEFDEVVENMDFDLKNFTQSLFLRKMLKIAQNKQPLLASPAK